MFFFLLELNGIAMENELQRAMTTYDKLHMPLVLLFILYV